MIDFRSEIEKEKENFINDLATLVSYPSVQDDSTAKENQPFGKANRDVLDAMLSIGQRDGFATAEVDGYAGHIDIGEGEETFGVLGHLDVVPVNDIGWDSNPFVMKRENEILYGRGVVDDKGALLAGYYACKIINKLDLDTRMKMRVIFGCNEELGSKCVKHYFTKMPFPKMGFTPDASFPVVYGEKAMATVNITGSIAKKGLISMFAGKRANIVPEEVIAIVEGSYKNYLKSFNDFLEKNHLDGTCEEEGNHTRLILKGKSAHASLPHEGKNAVSYLALYLVNEIDNELIKLIADNMSDYHGVGLKIAQNGLMGDLTMNLGVIGYKNDQVSLTLDIRASHEIDFAKMSSQIQSVISPYQLQSETATTPGLYVDPQSELITKLHQAYQEVTQTNDQPQTMGGGTYAKSMPNCVAFGVEFDGYDYKIHGNNENIPVDHLMLATEIYCKAIYSLIK